MAPPNPAIVDPTMQQLSQDVDEFVVEIKGIVEKPWVYPVFKFVSGVLNKAFNEDKLTECESEVRSLLTAAATCGVPHELCFGDACDALSVGIKYGHVPPRGLDVLKSLLRSSQGELSPASDAYCLIKALGMPCSKSEEGDATDADTHIESCSSLEDEDVEAALPQKSTDSDEEQLAPRRPFHLVDDTLNLSTEAPAVAATKSEYMVFARGRPSKDRDFKRVDALARTARAALSKGSKIHIVFEEEKKKGGRALLTLSPEFVGHQRPWGTVNKATQQSELSKCLQSLLDGEEVQGATYCYISHKNLPRNEIDWKNLESCVESVLQNRFDQVWILDEEGDQLFGCEETGSVASTAHSTSVLVALGGVRDMEQIEKDVLIEACKQRGIPQHFKSLGSRPELTSKCIRTLESLKELGLLGVSAEAVAKAQTIAKMREEAVKNARPSRRPWLFIVVYLTEKLKDDLEYPIAANRLVDAFMGSHKNLYKDTVLILIGKDNQVLTITFPSFEDLMLTRQLRGVKDEKHALEQLKSAHAHEYKGLSQELKEGLKAAGQKPDLAQTVVLHADSNAPPLRCSSCDLTCDISKSVAVVFAPNGRNEEISCDAKASAGAYVSVAIGHPSHGVAFAQMLHNEGFLIGAAQAADKRTDVAESQRVARCPSSSTVATLADR